MAPPWTDSTAAPAAGGLVDALAALRHQLAAVSFTLDLPGAAPAEAARRDVVGQIDDHLLPRLRDLGAPLLAVVGGSTGAGKSTLVNSLVGADVSPAGVLRPTTRAPVLAVAPQDVPWFEGHRVLPGLARTTSGPTHEGSLRLVAHPRVPPGLALLDAPDIDSVVEANRRLAGQLLSAADLWLFVTSAARYADAVPWELLRRARFRGTALAVILDRVPDGAEADLAAHLGEMLADEGLGGTPLFPVPEAALVDGRLPDQPLQPLRRWLSGLAADADARAAVVRRTLEGALASLPSRVEQVAAAADAERAALAALSARATEAYVTARRRVADDLGSGGLLRGEVLARWQELLGTGELMRALETRVGALRDRLRRAVTGEPPPTAAVRAALERSVEAVVVAAADQAAARAVDAWRASPGGADLLGDEAGRLDRARPGFPDDVAREVRAWQGHVLDLVGRQSAGKRATARALSLGVNAGGVALMTAVFAQTGGLTGAELAVAGGTATVSQKLLEAVFGDQAVRSLTAQARDDLLARLGRLLDGEATRFTARVAAAAPAADRGAALRRAVAAVEAARP